MRLGWSDLRFVPYFEITGILHIPCSQIESSHDNSGRAGLRWPLDCGTISSHVIKPLRLFVSAVFLLTSLVAQADVGDRYVVPSVAYSDDDGYRLINDSIAGGQIQVGKEMGRYFWLEGLLGYHDIDGLPGQEHLEIGLNAVGILRPDSLFSPYAIGGLGYLRADVALPDFGGSPPAGSTASNMTATASRTTGTSALALRPAQWSISMAVSSLRMS